MGEGATCEVGGAVGWSPPPRSPAVPGHREAREQGAEKRPWGFLLAASLFRGSGQGPGSKLRGCPRPVLFLSSGQGTPCVLQQRAPAYLRTTLACPRTQGECLPRPQTHG